MSEITIAIVDDHQLFADALKNVLPVYTNVRHIETLSSGPELYTYLETNTIDVLLLDLGIKDGPSGFEILKEVKFRRPQIKVIVVSMHTQQEYISKVKDLGGNGYVPKNAGASILRDAIRAVLAKDTFYTNLEESLSNPFNELSSTEKKIALALLQGLSNKQIAENLHRSLETINTHRKNIYKKLEVNNVVEFVKLGVKYGMITDSVQ